MTEASAEHWQRTYRERSVEELSWTESAPTASLAMIEEAALPPDAAIIDAGGGASGLAAELLRRGYSEVTVADISAAAIERAKADLGDQADRVRWVEADLREHDFGARFDLWHDRALFHFMVEPADRDGYLAVLNRTLKPGGHVVLAAFGPDGPSECSGLAVSRYDAAGISQAMGPRFELVSTHLVEHRTPSGTAQQFIYAHLRHLTEQPKADEHERSARPAP